MTGLRPRTGFAGGGSEASFASRKARNRAVLASVAARSFSIISLMSLSRAADAACPISARLGGLGGCPVIPVLYHGTAIWPILSGKEIKARF
jgi:hypothetical protein